MIMIVIAARSVYVVLHIKRMRRMAGMIANRTQFRITLMLVDAKDSHQQ